ncbi:MAG TPA: dephospho-CoA kinase [Bacteroidia bacterium]|nr:dephospho-CoA kinase [Bacteroidia bacterium]HNU33878.1 dephospho-CoA kinase [Bacteroidia bacterium]
MLKVGITGGIGSGKSYVAKIFSELGIAVYDADEFAKKLMQTNAEVVRQIKLLLGDEAYINETVNRRFIAEKIYSNKDLLTSINSIVHPAVANHFNDWCAEQKSKYVLKEAAIMFESGANKDLGYVITVSAPLQLRKQRTLKRDGMTEEKFISIVNNQLTEEERNAMADFVLVNDEEQPLLHEVVKLHEFFLAKCN